jgi:hypothetical protein
VDQFAALGFDAGQRRQLGDVVRAGAREKAGIAWFGHHSPKGRKKETSFFAKKEAKKLLITTALEWPQYGRSKAVVSKSFFGYFFFKKSNCLLTFSTD